MVAKYDPATVPKLVFKYSLLGATQKEMAEFFDVPVLVFTKWRDTYPEMAAALRQGKAQADAKVAQSLYKRAIGYTTKEQHYVKGEGVVTIDKNIQPDVTACIFWLKNRRPELWRDRTDPTMISNTLAVSDAEVARRIAYLLSQAVDTKSGNTIDVEVKPTSEVERKRLTD